MVFLHHLLLYLYGDIGLYYSSFNSIINVVFISVFYSFPYIVYKIIRLTIFIVKNGLSGINPAKILSCTLRYLLISITVIFIFSFLDIFLFRGFFIIPLLSKSNGISEERHDLSYSIRKSPDGWEFKIKNNEYKFYCIHAIRYIGYNLVFPDSLFFSFTSRPVISVNDEEIRDRPGGFYCTGFKEVLIFPKEEIKYTYKSTYNFFNEDHYFGLHEIDNLPSIISVRFYYPFYELMRKDELNTMSNSIDINTKQLMTVLEKKTEELRSIIERAKKE
jgi:hypothetical protein